MPQVWGNQVLPRLTEAALRNDGIGRYRSKVARELNGEIVEIGFGSGLNVAHYPPTVNRVIAIEPSLVARGMASERIAGSPVAVELRGLDGQHLPLGDSSVDGALSTFTLCTIPDVRLALSEIYRVLKPGGSFAFLEHGASPNQGVARWQNRLNALQQRFAGGCNLNRPIDRLITAAGFSTIWIEQEQLPGMKAGAPWSYFYYGVAQKPLTI